MKSSQLQLITLTLLVGLLGVNLYVALKLDQMMRDQAYPLADQQESPPILDVDLKFHTLDEVRERFDKLANLGALERATTIAEIDGWFIEPKDEDAVQMQMGEQLQQLREQIVIEIKVLQKQTLQAQNGHTALQFYGDANALLSLFPLDPEEDTVMQQALELSTSQLQTAARMKEAQHLRYNRWATERIAAAIKGYHDNSSSLSPKAENPKLIASLVTELATVSPMLLEPLVLDLYSYAIQITNDDISEDERTELVEKLTDPSIERKTLEDF